MKKWFAQEAIASPGPGLPSELLWCGLLICIFIEQIHHLQTTGRQPSRIFKWAFRVQTLVYRFLFASRNFWVGICYRVWNLINLKSKKTAASYQFMKSKFSRRISRLPVSRHSPSVGRHARLPPRKCATLSKIFPPHLAVLMSLKLLDLVNHTWNLVATLT